MDKLRALQYLIVAAETASFSATARRLEVSVTAVAKMITALEHAVGVKLVERSAKGLALTGTGAAYVQACAPLLRELAEADEHAAASSVRTPGTVVVAVQHVIARECITPALPRFHARHPEIELDIRDFNRTEDFNSSGVDVFLAMGWPQVNELVHRRIGAARFIVLASPAYWAANGLPQRPEELERYNCLPIRALDGTIMDLWAFERDGERISISVRSWVVASNGHRDVAMDLAIAGAGVIRMLDWTSRPEVAAGLLVPALTDWQSAEAPPVNLLFRPSVRRSPRVRKFIDFATDVLEKLTTAPGVVASERPAWVNRHHGRSSVSARRR